jgi:opacity protein-like surface antigen
MKSHPDRLNRAWFLLLGVAGFAFAADAQIPMAWEPIRRAPRLEVYGLGQYLHSDNIWFPGPAGDVRMRMDDTGLGGLGLAYHFNDYFAVRGDFAFGCATFRADGAGYTPPALARDSILTTGRLNLDYNIINRRLTPFVTAGIGYQYVSSEIENHPPIWSCSWDPWWGSTCGYYQPYYSETDFTWNVGAGLRWNVTDRFFIKAMGGLNWLKYSGARDITQQIEAIFSIGFTF